MKAVGFISLFLLIGASAIMCLGFSRKGSTTKNPGIISIESIGAPTYAKFRKLKDGVDSPTSDEKDEGRVKLEDYRPIDPVPSAKANIRPGPIQHGTPLMPYIPQPSPPPTQTEHGFFP